MKTEGGGGRAKNWARIHASCRGLRTGGGNPKFLCGKCGTVHTFDVCPMCGCPRNKQGRKV